MIVILLIGTTFHVSQPSIVEDCNGDLQLCEDGVGEEASKYLTYACPCCGKYLFKSSELKWATEDGYWQSPAHTLQNECYNIPTEVITCPDCRWIAKLSFFSYMG